MNDFRMKETEFRQVPKIHSNPLAPERFCLLAKRKGSIWVRL